MELRALEEQKVRMRSEERRRAYRELDEHMRRSGFYDTVSSFPILFPFF